MTIAVPYDWLRHIPHSVVEKLDHPVFGYPPPFPWEQFAAIFAKVFQLENVRIKASPWEMRLGNALYEGLSDKLQQFSFDLSPLVGNFSFVFAERDVDRLMNLLLKGNPDAPTLIDVEYRQGFQQFLALQLINIFTSLEYVKGVTPHLLEIEALPGDTSLCQDITLDLNGVPFVGRLILSEQFRNSWKERFAERSLKAKMSKELAEKVQVIVHLEAGKTTLTHGEWNQAAVGDFLCLDHCSLEGDGEKGRVILTLNGKPLYRAKVKDGGVKILESPLFHAIHTPITPQPKQEGPLPDTFDEEFTDFDEEFSEIESPAPVAAPAPKAAPAPSAEVPPVSPPPVQAATEGVSVAPSSSPVHLEDVPITVVIEVGRIQISVQKLMELEPGNLLDLDIHPENGVDLVVHGNVIGKGELLKIGDSLGVRILDKA